jgi:neutral amino acid transport system substrate-binding protein
MGRNFEQAMLLAVEDVNDAGGVHGTPLSLDTRDSNSGSQRGLNDLLSLIYTDKVQYLVGPDENALANDIVSDVKALDILNVLPGYAAPSTARVSASGAWMRLAPLPAATGCALAAHALDEGANRVNTLASVEDYNATLASYFASNFAFFNGSSTPSVTIQTGQNSYFNAINTVFGYGADRTLLVAYPETAATVVTEASALGAHGTWYLSPLLNADVFLLNIPYGALEGAFGLSPSLSLASECATLTTGTHGPVQCARDNADRFSDHFAERWNGARPFPAAYLYYDAVVLLAMGMQYSMATQGSIPSAQGLEQQVLALNASTNDPGRWSDLKTAMSSLAQGKALRYVGAGAEYQFDRYGAAQYHVFDTWTVHGQSFASTGAYSATCAN